MADTGEQRAELARLRRQLAEVRRERMAAQRDTAARRSVELALAAVERDRDAGASPQLDELHARGQELTDRLLGACREADHARVMLARLVAAGFDADVLPAVGPVRAALAAEAGWRETADSRLSAAGVPLRLPPPADVALPAHPRREELARLAGEQPTPPVRDRVGDGRHGPR